MITPEIELENRLKEAKLIPEYVRCPKIKLLMFIILQLRDEINTDIKEYIKSAKEENDSVKTALYNEKSNFLKKVKDLASDDMRRIRRELNTYEAEKKPYKYICCGKQSGLITSMTPFEAKKRNKELLELGLDNCEHVLIHNNNENLPS